MNRITKVFILATVPILAFACSQVQAPPADLGESSTALVEENGISVNGISVNGISVNGISVNGISVNGISVNGISVNGISVNGISVNGRGLAGPTADGLRLDEAALIGATLQGSSAKGGDVALRIDAIDANPDPANADLPLYAVSVWSEHKGGAWRSLCTDDAGGAVRSTPLRGRWDYRQGQPGAGGRIDDPGSFTFACEHAALYKCAALGYKPWRGLADHHESCVRMLRADYCGNGRSHTISGTLVNVFDGIGVQADGADWPVEAEWDRRGARCMKHPRYSGGKYRPSCQEELIEPSCGDTAHFASGTLLINESIEGTRR